MTPDQTNTQYPKVLIFGQSFNNYTGGGITKMNLFKNWPPDKIVVATPRIEISGTEYCKSYYKLGYSESKRPWPFYLFQPKYKSGPVQINTNTTNETSAPLGVNTSKYNRKLKNAFNKILHFVGIYYWIFRYYVSENFLQWIDQIKPDIIYTQLAKLEYINFILELITYRPIPLVIHFMDDWPETINQPGIISFYWKKKIDSRVRYLLDRSALLMSICNSMSEEYKNRYSKEFIPFHNTIDWSHYRRFTKNSYQTEGTFKILYAGRIGTGTSGSVLSLIQAIDILVKKGLNIEFQLQTNNKIFFNKYKLWRYNFITKQDYLPYEELPQKFSDMDLLVLPMDFDKKNLKFIHLSMPTKVPEYMASGTPILVFAAESTALSKYAHAQKWAAVVNSNSIEILTEEIERLYSDDKYRKEIGEQSVSVVRMYHDALKVRKQFVETLSNCINER